MVLPAITMFPGFTTQRDRDEKVLHFYAVVPIYEFEMKRELRRGADALNECVFESGRPRCSTRGGRG